MPRRPGRQTRGRAHRQELGSVEHLPAFDEPFDKILAVNATMFWREPVIRLEELFDFEHDLDPGTASFGDACLGEPGTWAILRQLGHRAKPSTA